MTIYILQLIGILISAVILGVVLNTVDVYKKVKKIPFTTCGTNKTPIIKVNQGNTIFNFIIDTGSSISAIDKKYIPDLLALKLNKTTEVIGIEGNPEKVSFYEIDFECNNHLYTHNVIAKSFGNAFDPFLQEYNIVIHGMLGSDFFTKYKFIVDFKTQTLNV